MGTEETTGQSSVKIRFILQMYYHRWCNNE